jgi:ArsR family transcriptional regulator
MDVVQADNALQPLFGAPEPLEREDAVRLATVLMALADPARLRIVSLICSSSEKEMCVSDMVPHMGLSQPTVSYHLGILAEAGLVEREKRGHFNFCRLNLGALDNLADLLHRRAPGSATAETTSDRHRGEPRCRSRKVKWFVYCIICNVVEHYTCSYKVYKRYGLLC